MKAISTTSFGSFLFAVIVATGILAAQETRTFQVPVPPPANGDQDVLFWNDADGDDGPEMEWLDSGPEVAAAPMPHFTAGRRVIIRGEAGPWLGVAVSDLDAEQSKGSKLASENGVLVKNVSEDSPAAKAGLMKDDVIVEFAGDKVRSSAQFRRLVRETPPGRSVSIVVNRAGKNQTLTAKVEDRHPGTMAMGGAIQAGPGEFNMPLPPPAAGEGRNFKFFVQPGARLGISGDDLTPQLAEYFGVKQGKGVLVREVIVGSSAEKAGLKAGDVVVAVDGQEIATVGKLRRTLAGQKADTEKRKVTLTIVRDKHEQTLTVELDSPDKFMPKPVMRTELGIDPDAAMEMADEAASRAKEIGLAWSDRAKIFQDEWQTRMQEEKKQLEKEIPRLQEEIEKEVHNAMAELEHI